MRSATVTRLLHTRGLAASVGVACVAAGLMFFLRDGVPPIQGDRGFALPSANEWFYEGWPSYVGAMATNGLIVLVAAMLCKVFNILRGMSGLYITLFAVMQLATPQLFDQFYTGPVLALAAAAGLYLMFGRYRSPAASGHVFLTFMMLSALTATQYCFALFMPAFLIVCAQMRVFNGRSLVAAAVGVVTPWWLLTGFGIVTAAGLHVPEFRNIFDGADTADLALTLGTVGFTALLLVLSIVLNLFKTIAYNARSRAVNGALTVVAAFAVAGGCLDFNNILAYVPLLNLCAALQATHYFSTHRADRSCIPIAAIIAVYVILFVCQTQI